MNHEERGFYILLLCVQWSTEGISSDDFARLGRGLVEPSLNHVQTKFQQGADGLWRNKRLEEVRAKFEAYRVSQSDKGKASAKQRLNRGSTAVEIRLNREVNPIQPSTSTSISTVQCTESGGVGGVGDVAEPIRPTGFPKTEEEAVAVAAFVGCPPDFAVLTYNKAMSRGYKDAKGIVIGSWSHYLKTEWTYQQGREAGKHSEVESRTSRREPFISELKAVMDAKKKVREQIIRRGHEDGFGFTPRPEDAEDFKLLNREIAALLNQLSKAKP